MFFLRKASLERLPVVMSGVRMGERALQIGIADPSLAGAIAAKVGLSGHAAIVVSEEASALKARAAAAAAGVLADIHVTPLDALPFTVDAFDVVILHAGGVRGALHDTAAGALLHDAHRVLRSGGRILIIAASRPGLLARLRPSPPGDPAGTISALTVAGFKSARVLADREGYRFIEGLKH